MGLESPTHIDDLVATNPTTTDGLAQGDDHIRNIKSVLKTDFPSITGVVTASHGDLSAVENFEETVSATTSEVTIKTGKTLNIVDDGAGLEFGGTPLTSTVAELNQLDGVVVTGTSLRQYVHLDTPELITSSPTTGAWTTVNNTTLNTANATTAVVKTSIDVTATTATYLSVTTYLRLTGSGLTVGQGTVNNKEYTMTNTSDTLTAYSVVDTPVNLDGSYDFDYFYVISTDGSVSVDSTDFYLVGYYI